MLLARKVAGEALEARPMAAIGEAARTALQHLRGVPHLVVRVHDGLVEDAETAKAVLGRFGWKAAVPTIRGQSTAAFANDIGITSEEVPDVGEGDVDPRDAVEAADADVPLPGTDAAVAEPGVHQGQVDGSPEDGESLFPVVE